MSTAGVGQLGYAGRLSGSSAEGGEMTLDEARKIYETEGRCRGIFSELNEDTVVLDGWFSADELEAIAIVMRAERAALDPLPHAL